MIEDAELLRRYAEEESQAAFAELVHRHINFVYASALRRLGGDTHLAEDVTQQVFTALAQRAPALASRAVLSGWLYTTARNAAAHAVRGERRRQARESAAHSMNELTSPSAADAEWERLRPVLDGVMDSMNNDDRQAVLLRYFEGKSYADIGARLRLAENTARMRVERALEKLRTALERRGVNSTSAGLAIALASHAGVAAPAGLAASVTGAALGGAAASAGGWLTTIIGIGKLHAGLAGAMVLAGGAAYYAQSKSNAGLRQEIATIAAQRQALPALRAENEQLAAAAAEVAMLRSGEAELKQLAERAAELKRTHEENAQVALVRALDRRKQLEEWLREQDRLVQAEVDRMNREGNALVKEFKRLSSRSKDGTLAADARAEANAAAKMKLEEIRTKQREIKAFIEESRRVLLEHQAELRRLPLSPADPLPDAARERLDLERRAAEIEQRRSARNETPTATPTSPVRGTLILRP